MSAPGTSEYQARKWQIVEEELGYENIYETNEDGQPGDLVASVYGDNAHLIAASPALYDALDGLKDILDRAESNASGNMEWEHVSGRINAARAALRLARGEAA